MNKGTAYGTLRKLTAKELDTAIVSMHDILILETLPAEIPLVAASISKDAQTDSEFREALEKEYGDLTDIRYYAMDISLYSPDGVTKIPAPEGVKVTLTVPLPNDMAVYGGNNKVGAVVNGDQLEKLGVRFSSIDGQPCATFTATHFSPYGFYVDINNLSAAGDLDATPKTGDPISPKWFFSIGLAALSIFLFLKKDPKPSAEPQG